MNVAHITTSGLRISETYMTINKYQKTTITMIVLQLQATCTALDHGITISKASATHLITQTAEYMNAETQIRVTLPEMQRS
jgi:hypothetical protein